MARLAAEQYNYRIFSQAAHELLDSYADSPRPGTRAEDFPLTALDGTQVGLRALCGEHYITVVEFGSIT